MQNTNNNITEELNFIEVKIRFLCEVNLCENRQK